MLSNLCHYLQRKPFTAPQIKLSMWMCWKWIKQYIKIWALYAPSLYACISSWAQYYSGTFWCVGLDCTKSNRYFGEGGCCYNKLEFEGRVPLILKSAPNAGKVYIGNKRKNQVYSSYYVLYGCRMASNWQVVNWRIVFDTDFTLVRLKSPYPVRNPELRLGDLSA